MPTTERKKDNLAQFPELQRARELFVDLFQDRSPLVNLGYSTRQIAFAVPVLSRMQEGGNIRDYIRDYPSLFFGDLNDPDYEGVEIGKVYQKKSAW